MDNAKSGLVAELPGSLVFGVPGKSAYQYAVEGGYTGTEEEFARLPVTLIEQQTEYAKEIKDIVNDGEDAPPIICTGEGAVITAKDASDRLLRGLRIYGKTTQDGTPTPDSPGELVNVGAGGEINTNIAGKNLIAYPYDAGTKTIAGVTFTDNGDGTITADGTATANAVYVLRRYNLQLAKGSYILSGIPSDGSQTTYMIQFGQLQDNVTVNAANCVSESGRAVTITDDALPALVQLVVSEGYTASNLVFKPMIRPASIADGTYEPYKGQTLHATISGGLPGIPVSSGGNCTIDGQQYISSYRDWGKGVDVQAVGVAVFDGSDDEAWIDQSITNGLYRYHINITDRKTGLSKFVQEGLCSSLPVTSTVHYTGITTPCFSLHPYDRSFNVWVEYATLAEWKAYLAANPMTVQYELAEPIETSIPAEELAAYMALRTNKPHTTIYNDAGAYMEADYVADTKTYIDNQIAALSAALVNNI